MPSTSTAPVRRTVEHLDARDRATIAIRMAHRLGRHAPEIGDYVRFPDGTLERISEPLTDGHAQTSRDARFQLREHGTCYCTSGSHNRPVALGSLRPTRERLFGDAWIWHHDRRAAGNGVEFRVAFKVFDFPEERTSTNPQPHERHTPNHHSRP